MSHPQPKTKPKTFGQRLETISEIETKIDNLHIRDLPAMKVLQLIMNSYLKDGTSCDTKLNLNTGDRARVIIIKLFNDKTKKDIVLITAKDEIQSFVE